MSDTATLKTVVVTGASSGIGKEAAKALANMGWQVFAVGRNAERCRQAEAEIRSCAGLSSRITMICADLAFLSEVEAVISEIEARTDVVDVILNNAGGVSREREITPEGNEYTFASNHLGHFHLTTRLLPLLRTSVARQPAGTTRIINVSSTGHEACEGLDWEDLQSVENFVSGQAYCRAKLANILFTRELHRRFVDEGITAHAMHPGVVDSNFISHVDDAMRRYMESLEGQPPKVAADTLIWLASARGPGQCSGNYYFQRQSIPASAAGTDDKASLRLWQESDKLVARSLAHAPRGRGIS